MKRYISLLIQGLLSVTLTFFLASKSSAQPVSRGVDWIHGLGGDASSLEADDHFFHGERLIDLPYRNSYPTGDGIETMAILARSWTGGSNRLGIGHSMGGVAVRHITLDNSTHWKGVVTMGSPLRGAGVAAPAPMDPIRLL